MEERFVEIATPSGRMETFVTHPEQDGPFPPVIIYMDIWGVREELFEIARRVGTVGYYCLVPDPAPGGGSLHGTSIISDAPDSPHHLAKHFRGELYCGFAEMDPYAPLSMVKELEALLRPCLVDYRYAIHEGAQHGYALPNRDIFDPHGAARDWEQIFAMFHRRIPPYEA